MYFVFFLFHYFFFSRHVHSYFLIHIYLCIFDQQTYICELYIVRTVRDIKSSEATNRQQRPQCIKNPKQKKTWTMTKKILKMWGITRVWITQLCRGRECYYALLVASAMIHVVVAFHSVSFPIEWIVQSQIPYVSSIWINCIPCKLNSMRVQTLGIIASTNQKFATDINLIDFCTQLNQYVRFKSNAPSKQTSILIEHEIYLHIIDVCPRHSISGSCVFHAIHEMIEKLTAKMKIHKKSCM